MVYEQPSRRVSGLSRNAKIGIIGLFIIIVGIVLLSNSFVTVNAGYRGVLLTWGKPTATFNEGLHFKIPIAQQVVMMNVQVQKAETTETAASSDLQDVGTTIAVNYRLDPNWVMEIYTTLQLEAEQRVINPNIQESIKAVTAGFTAEELITKRPDVKTRFESTLEDHLDRFHIIVESVSITNFEFSQSFTKAIEDKVTQQQKALEAENKLKQITAEAQQKVIQAEAEKKAAIAKAEGEAQAQIIKAESEANATKVIAEATAYQIELINKKIADNPYYLQYAWIQEWDGQLPSTLIGDENVTLLLQGAPVGK
ncbi:prohibitin family protein [Candidatus Bathyarchaeota archaeon]|nr:prohibitin family protein [Candidatus Bathyarchaeota archaeon]